MVSAQYRFGWFVFFASSAALAFALARDWNTRAILFLVTVPLTLWALRGAGRRFIEWNRKPRERTPEQVADLLRRALAGTATDGEIDYFISVDIIDPALNDVKDRVGALYGPGWSSEETRADLRALLREVEGMSPATVA
jgi:hypothetical protein